MSTPPLGRAGWREIGIYSLIVAGLHAVGWTLVLVHARDSPTMLGLGLAAYLFGLRHAFDVDHIAAVDDTVRLMLQNGRNPLGVGFYFSLGHSTVVFLVAVAVASASAAIGSRVPALRDFGATFGACVSGLFLIVVGWLNLRVLIGVGKAWAGARSGAHDHAHLDALLAQRGFMSRLFGRRLRQGIGRSWQVYPVGFLFGLGFDTASEIALLTMTASVSAAVLPLSAALALPTLFAAGMLAIDTTDGVLMCKAYRWSFDRPLRRLAYNLATTGLSVALALGVGAVELAQTWVRSQGARGAVADWLRGVDFGALGYVVVGLFAVLWVAALSWPAASGSRRPPAAQGAGG